MITFILSLIHIYEYIKLMQKDDSLCIGAIMEASYQTRRVMQGIIDMVDYLKYNQDILLSESENDLFHLYFELDVYKRQVERNKSSEVCEPCAEKSRYCFICARTVNPVSYTHL